MMTALERILSMMPDDEHRQSFLRIVNEAGVREDSPDMVVLALDHEARWSAVQAMAAERERIETLVHDVADAVRDGALQGVRAAGSEIANECGQAVFEKMGALVDDLEVGITTAVGKQLGDHAHAVDTLTARSGALVSDLKKATNQFSNAAYEHTRDVAALRRKTESWWIAAIVILCLTFVGAFAFGEFVATGRHTQECRYGVSTIHMSAHDTHLVQARACTFGL